MDDGKPEKMLDASVQTQLLDPSDQSLEADHAIEAKGVDKTQ